MAMSPSASTSAPGCRSSSASARSAIQPLATPSRSNAVPRSRWRMALPCRERSRRQDGREPPRPDASRGVGARSVGASAARRSRSSVASTIPPLISAASAALRWAADAAEMSGGIVDATLLRERLAAEAPTLRAPTPLEASGRGGSRPSWRLERSRQGSAILHRERGTAFDLDGVAKGWIADRALALLDRHPGALVDADGDIAIRSADGDSWEVSVADPRTPGAELAAFVLPGARLGARYGLATSGISVHRWAAPDGERHHLIDPRTGMPAATDVVQATVLAGTARAAEAWAKTAVVLGLVAALDVLDRAPVLGAILLAADGRVLAVPRTTRWLA